MERLILLSIVNLVLSAQEDESCPKTVSSWKEKEAAIHCGRDKYYHCLKDEKRRAVQTCLSRSWVQPGFCPEYNSVANEIDVFSCKENLGECPVATFWSNELYKFSACLNAVSTEEVEDNVKTNGGVNGKEDSLGTPLVILIACSSIALLMAVFTILWCVFKRKKEDTSTLQEIELSPMEAPGEKCDKTNTLETTMPLITHQNDISLRTKVYSRENNRDNEKVNEKPAVRERNENVQRNYEEIPKERINSVMDNQLKHPGDRLLLILKDSGEIYTIANKLENRKPGFIQIDKFSDWSKTEDKEDFYVLLTCLMTTVSSDTPILHNRKELDSITSDIENWKLKVVIAIRSDIYEKEQHLLRRNKLFQNIACFKIKNV